ncbi:MAG: 6-phosphogluconate dehydrogenase (decarboxylating) [Candidatus Spechtbacteria bacterium RIFCSPHIGHO2_02_FULL_43_15b]|uniref:6-phosphogluconate dehydrogenase (Decarboxylating) n=1 Tax=Candidatus Spechtbacteria bacterium RIFCSPHIGHO2_01_FULL_43_30 TaxID=1802158 RepID=A0A1G2H6Y7_9BACT|nr:MAG: 6-phosphogluconate dehydrogenase (decarboxylating) [Candidatus Spechtbacteria bacterium RIFCSPHIGHO2_01_FULL_43_30]OGZ58989.1 MAG: 6-phosphogluconate dehydrogenase (decarboxylating) [Candidatus Spechtbacteria bacterium RIFCSPHIGHO2_02_FULL_43_15b]
MVIGYIGLGKMGKNMATRIMGKGYEVFGFDANEDARKFGEKEGLRVFSSIAEMAKRLSAPRIVWIMVPHNSVSYVLENLTTHLSEGDFIIDGGNSFYKDSVRRSKELNAKGIKFLDVGVSGGPGGAKNGSCLMVGGAKEDYKKFEPLFRDLSVEGGYGYMGSSGAGHFVKMIHNGIEYGMMQSLAEGFTILKNSEFNLRLENIADLYNHGSVIESRLAGWLKEAFEEFDEDMEGVSGIVGKSGEGEWTSATAKEMAVAVPVIDASVKFRIDSIKNPSYTGKLLSAIRNIFGGHKA